MTLMMKPDLGELEVNSCAEHVEITVEDYRGNSLVLVLSKGEILEYVAEELMHLHLANKLLLPF